MRLAVIDASPVGGGPLTHALACAAGELPKATVVRVRAFDLSGKVCAVCSACSQSGRCTKHHPALDEAIALLGAADALIVGTAGRIHAHDPRSRALLERLVGAFGHVETTRGLGSTPTPRAGRKRAALVCSAPPFLGVPAMLGMLPAGVAGVWKILERAGTGVVGCTSVGTRWSGPTSFDRAGESARRLGRLLAAPATPRMSPNRAATPQRPSGHERLRARLAATALAATRPV